MVVIRHEIRQGAYCDSVVLMQLQKFLASKSGVQDAGAVMATPANLSLLAESGLLPSGLQAGADDLLIVVSAGDEAAASDALGQVDEFFAHRRSAGQSEFRPHSLDTAIKILPEASWVSISVAGRYAAGLARQALQADRHVFLYSDNVSLEDELDLKQSAHSKGLLVMGPDCGTAWIGGVGFGFANRVRPGPIGLIGASGTGLQALMVAVHALGSGVSHALGTGGRDLSQEVGAITTLQCLDLLARDPATGVIALVSKPPSPGIVPRLLAAAQATGKPVVLCMLGYPPPSHRLGRVHFALNLNETADLAVSLLQDGPPPPLPTETSAGASSSQSLRTDPSRPAASHPAQSTGNPPVDDLQTFNLQPATNGGKYLRGLFSGGTLAYETLLGLRAILDPLYSNLSISGVLPLPEPTRSQAHTVVDLGSDEFTVGRLHPMIDQQARLSRLRQEAADPQVGVILLDLVLGEGAHPDPASELVPAIAALRQDRQPEILVLLVGTDEDIQGSADQADRLQQAGARVLRSAGEALEYLSQRWGSRPEAVEPPVPLESLQPSLAVVNIGLESFYQSLVAQGAQAIHLDWRPPAGGNERIASILSRLK